MTQLLSFVMDFGMDLDAAIHQPRIDASEGAIVIGDIRLPAPVHDALRARFDYEQARIQTFPMKFACPSVVMRQGTHELRRDRKRAALGRCGGGGLREIRGWRWLADRALDTAFSPRSTAVAICRDVDRYRAPPSPTHSITRSAAASRAMPGALLRSEPYTKRDAGGARGWRILYATDAANHADSRQRPLSSRPRKRPHAPRPVIAWAHGTTGIVPGCAPSVDRALRGRSPHRPRHRGELRSTSRRDYPGLGTPGGHAYLVGEDAARAVLDAIRAARRLEGLALDNRAVVWGHSQGGNSALWTGIRADDYAPDVNIAGRRSTGAGERSPGAVQERAKPRRSARSCRPISSRPMQPPIRMSACRPT